MKADDKDVYQLSLMEIDRDETWKRTEEELERASTYQRVGIVRKEIRNTPSYEPREHQGTNAISKPCEDIAVWNVDNELRLKQAYDRVQRALRGLKRTERRIIELLYFNNDDVFNYNVYTELNMSERTYGRYKTRAMYQLAFAMGLEVYKEDI